MEITEDKNEYAPKKTRGVANDGGDGVLALLEGKASELNDNVLRASVIFHFFSYIFHLKANQILFYFNT